MFRTFRIQILLLTLILLFPACAHFRQGPQVLDTLYFGLNRPGGQVTEQEWTDFLDTEVTPRFGEGFTVIEGKGQWKDKEGKIAREPSKLLQVAHEDSPQAEAKLDALIKSYKQKFDQESVLRVRQAAELHF